MQNIYNIFCFCGYDKQTFILKIMGLFAFVVLIKNYL